MLALFLKRKRYLERAEMPNDMSCAVKGITAQWTTKIETIATVIGRLGFLGSLRDPNTGIYVHHGMATAVGDHTHGVLLKSHQTIFQEWKKMPFPNQVKDVETFVASLSLSDCFPQEIEREAKNKIVLDTWTELEPYRSFVPLTVSKLEKKFFMTRLSGIIAILKAQSEKKNPSTSGSSSS